MILIYFSSSKYHEIHTHNKTNEKLLLTKENIVIRQKLIKEVCFPIKCSKPSVPCNNFKKLGIYDKNSHYSRKVYKCQKNVLFFMFILF